MKNKLKYLLILTSFFLVSLCLFAQGIPDKPNPPKLVNDYAGLLSADELNMLERKLDLFNDSTSTQIAVVIVGTLNDLEPADYAQQLGEKWGIGQKGKNNGVVILIKPTGGQGEKKVFIAPGYGLEAVIPDATCKLIVENEMIPYFRQNNYLKGIDAAVNVIMALSKKEYSASAYNKRHENNGGSQWAGIIIALIIIIFSLVFRGLAQRGTHYASGGNLPFWTLFWLMMMGSNSRGGHWNDFSSGSGSFGGFGGGGGFGGFGGGSFGGGGAGGSW